jgi:predicted O-methyltransferase YrrM
MWAGQDFPMNRLMARAGRVACDPVAAWERWRDDRERRREYAREAPVYRADRNWEARLHEMMAVPFPCPAANEFRAIWPQIVAFVTAKGASFGPESFYGWNDADPELARALWCVVRHTRPTKVVEAGVGHGISSRVLLEAIAGNGHGKLWSIDPPPADRRLAAEVGLAVDERLRPSWELVRGTSRRMLPGLVAGLGQIDLFLHDSLHTERNLRFEIAEVRPCLNAGAFAILDDIDTNWGFHTLSAQYPHDRFLIGQSVPVRPDTRRFDDKGLFGVIQAAADTLPTHGSAAPSGG